MTEYKTEVLDIVNNPSYTYYKLYVNDRCYFEDFYNEVMEDVKGSNDMASIVSLMENLGAQLLPAAKFNHIHDAKRSDLFEFKKNKLRVYVIKQEPVIYVVMGGHKNEQKSDIAKLKKRVKDCPKK